MCKYLSLFYLCGNASMCISYFTHPPRVVEHSETTVVCRETLYADIWSRGDSSLLLSLCDPWGAGGCEAVVMAMAWWGCWGMGLMTHQMQGKWQDCTILDSRHRVRNEISIPNWAITAIYATIYPTIHPMNSYIGCDVSDILFKWGIG